MNEHPPEQETKFFEGCTWQGSFWLLRTNMRCGYWHSRCRHAIILNPDDPRSEFIVPRVATGFGDDESVSLCIDCILEAVANLPASAGESVAPVAPESP